MAVTEARKRQEAARVAAEEALRLAPDAPEVHMAMGLYHYRCFRDYDRALDEIAIAAAARPNDADVISWKATLNKRQGNFAESIRLHRRVLELDPMDHGAANEIGVTHRLAGDFEKAIEAYDLSMAIDPDLPAPYFRKAPVYFAWKGTTDEARAALEAMPRTESRLANQVWFWLEYFEGRYSDALARIESGPETFADQMTLNVRAALAALCLEQLDRSAEAEAAWQEAVDLLEAQRRERPEDFRVHLDIAVPLAALGRDDEALEAARRAIRLMPMSKDVEAAPAALEGLVLTHVRMGQYDEAIEALEALPAGSLLTVPAMRLDPRFERLVRTPGLRGLRGARRLARAHFPDDVHDHPLTAVLREVDVVDAPGRVQLDGRDPIGVAEDRHLTRGSLGIEHAVLVDVAGEVLELLEGHPALFDA